MSPRADEEEAPRRVDPLRLRMRDVMLLAAVADDGRSEERLLGFLLLEGLVFVLFPDGPLATEVLAVGRLALGRLATGFLAAGCEVPGCVPDGRFALGRLATGLLAAGCEVPGCVSDGRLALGRLATGFLAAGCEVAGCEVAGCEVAGRLAADFLATGCLRMGLRLAGRVVAGVVLEDGGVVVRPLGDVVVRFRAGLLSGLLEGLGSRLDGFRSTDLAPGVMADGVIDRFEDDCLVAEGSDG